MRYSIMKWLVVVGGLLFNFTVFAEVQSYPLANNSSFPISQAVEVKAGTTIVYHSGTVPAPANPDATRFSTAFWGDTKTQALSVLD
jgi:hypothetical protein